MLCEKGSGGNARRVSNARPPQQVNFMAVVTHKPAAPRETLLMTRMETLVNPRNRRRAAIEALIFLDPGSEKSFVRIQTASTLGLPIIDSEEIVVTTLNNEKRRISANKHVVGVVQTDNSTVKIIAYGVPQVTKRMSTLASEDEMNKSHPQRIFKEPELLIGGDYMSSFAKLGAELPSGLRAIKTTLGDVAF